LFLPGSYLKGPGISVTGESVEFSAQVMPIAVSMEIVAKIFTKSAREALEKRPITMATTVLAPLAPSLAVENSLLGSPAAWQTAWLFGRCSHRFPPPALDSNLHREIQRAATVDIQLHSLRKLVLI